MMCSKTITMNLSTIVHLIVEPITSLSKPKASLEASIYIRQLPWTLTSSKPVISPSLFSFLFFGNMLSSNRYSLDNVEIHVVNSSDICGEKSTTRRLNWTAIRNCISIINLVKGRYFLCWFTFTRWKFIVESILIKSFWEFSDTNQFVIVVLLTT